MYSFIKQAGIKKLIAYEVPVMFISLIITELFYKFGSFTLECIAFAGTWFAISFTVTKIQKLFH